jgi:hypothetical protein
MHALVAFLQGLAVLVLVLAGLLTIVGATRARDGLLRVTFLLVGSSLAVPYVIGSIATGVSSPSCDAPTSGITSPPGIVIPVVLGHVALGVLLLRRWLRGGERARNDANEIERARGRERPRLPPEG